MLRWLGRLAVGVAATIGALTASQLPEFAQQYRQRLGGALDEMRRVVEDFDAGAARSQLTRAEALDRYRAADEPFLREQGSSVAASIDRYETLAEQRARLESAPPLMRPVVVLRNPDARIIRGAWQDYEPAFPTTPAGLVWAALGFFLLGGLVSFLRQLGGIARRWRRRPGPGRSPEALNPRS
jgi:hypothetical protein